MPKLISLEICAGAGGQALGLEQAGFDHAALVETDAKACSTLRSNRPNWRVYEQDVAQFNATALRGIDLLAGGIPCPPFSKAGKQLGRDDERDLFPEALRLVAECRPRVVMLENVRGLLDSIFDGYRQQINEDLAKLGYVTQWRLVNASQFGVPQLRPRVVLIALRRGIADHFVWPTPLRRQPPTVGQTLYDLMAARGWQGAAAWREQANTIAPTIVGGSKKHGGPDLGPTRAKRAWATLGVDGHGIANSAPDPDFQGNPRLTVPMVARLQGFPDDWQFSGTKTHTYRQVGNAFPPPVARAVAKQIRASILAHRRVLVPGHNVAAFQHLLFTE